MTHRHYFVRGEQLPTAPGQPVRWGPLPRAAMALAAAEVFAGQPGSVLLLTGTVAEAEGVEAALRFFLAEPQALALFPDLEVLPYEQFSPHQDLVSERLRILRDLDQGARRLVVTAIPTLLPRLTPATHLRQHALRFSVGETLELGQCRDRLELGGYRRVGQVTGHGEYTVRGSILDVFPMGSEWPVRLDFLDERLDSIRRFDPDTQLSTGKLGALDTLPAREFPTDAESVKAFRQRYRRRFEGNPANSVIYREISEGRFPAGIHNYLPLFFEQPAVLWDYLRPDTLVITVGDPAGAVELAVAQISERHTQLGSDIERPLLATAEVFCTPEETLARLRECRVLQLERGGIPGDAAATFDPGARSIVGPLVSAREADPGRRLLEFLESHPGRTLLTVESPAHRELLQELLQRAGREPGATDGWRTFLDSTAQLMLGVAPLDQGFLLPAGALAVLSEQELFGQPARTTVRRRRTRDPEQIIGDLTDLRPGVPVVHINHGVGRYVGLTRLDISSVDTEFVTLEYAGGDRLYVPVGSLHLISRYTGASPEQAPLHRLGTDQWEKARRRTAERIRDVAAELLELYSRRALRGGHSVRPDEAAYEKFAAGFPFTLTEDQAKAIDAVLEDLAFAKPMDRLVCGDVGFGKTEVALRAAFAVVTTGRQVAVLVPTTLLAQQHFETFSNRFAELPVQVEVISRFRKADEQRKIIERLGTGQVDIVIGTHRLLQKDVRFRDLGLVVVDEEQRFGVTHKEKLKALRAEVDILTLTATPIPRTLNMALGGLRELSLITTPPESRLTIRTVVTTWGNQVIREACLRELQRGGQIYFVHNRIEDIGAVAEKVAAIVPEARVEIAHGQMHETDLERVMLDFYHRRFQILVCTAIIESGLDVPSANTILIDRADQFGLAQLHQLRGRVGRSHHQAFAYLLAPPREALREDAARRLEALESLDDLGAGFVLATHDLEIRGAGELLGESQSGQIQEVGFALYNEMLGRAVDALRAGRAVDAADATGDATEIDLHVAALLPEEFMPDVHTRLVLYKRIASAPSAADLDALATEIGDRLGTVPQPTANMLQIAALRLRARAAGIARVSANATGGSVEFAAGTRVDPARLVRLIESSAGAWRLDARQRLMFRADLADPAKRLAYCENLVAKLTGEPAVRRQPHRPGAVA